MGEQGGFFERKQTDAYKGLTFGALSGMIENNPDNEALVRELQDRQTELNQNTELVNAVRARIAMLLTGERGYQTPDQIESEVFELNSDFNKPRYKDMVAQTIFAVSQEWKFRGEKNVYKPEDEEKLSESEKDKLQKIISQQHVKTGITGQHLPNYNQLATTGKNKSDSGLVSMAKTQRNIGLDGSVAYILDTPHQEKREAEFDLPDNMKDLTDIIQNISGNESDQKRQKAKERIAQMFKDGGSKDLGLNDSWYVTLSTKVQREVDKANGDWDQISTNLSNFIGSLEKGEVDSEDLFVKRYVRAVSQNAKYKGMVNAVLRGYQRYADEESKRLSAKKEAAQKVHERDRDEIKRFEIPVAIVDLESVKSGGAQQNTEKTKSEQNTRRETSPRNESGQDSDKWPETREAQRDLLLRYLREIESWPMPIFVQNQNDPAKRDTLNKLERHANRPDCEPMLRKEVLARLRLHHCYQIVLQAESIKGVSSDAYLKQAFEAPASAQYTLDHNINPALIAKGDIDAKMTDSEMILMHIKGVKEAYRILQNADYVGYDYRGSQIRLRDDLPNSQMEFILSNMLSDLEKTGLTQDEALESLELARRYDKATMSDSVRNINLTRPGILSPLIYLYDWRNKSGNDHGPDSNRNKILGLDIGPYLRIAKTGTKIRASNGKEVKEYAFLSSDSYNLELLAANNGVSPNSIKFDNAKSKSKRELVFQDYPELQAAYYARTRGLKVENNKAVPIVIDPDDINFSDIQRGQYFDWVTKSIPRCIQLKSLLLKEDYSPQETSLGSINDWPELFNAGDKTGFLNLRVWFVESIIAYANDNPSVWSAEQLKKFLQNVTNDTGKNGAFLSSEQLAYISSKTGNQIINQFSAGFVETITRRLGFNIG